MNIPENCKLVAVWAGDSWSLEVSNDCDETIAILEWPKSWPKTMTADQLIKYGFEIA